MDYFRSDGSIVIVEGDKAKYPENIMRQYKIGANFTHGTSRGGYLSSFDRVFNEEIIGIQGGFGDVVDARIGDITDAYELLKMRISTVVNADINELACIVLGVVDEFFCGHDNTADRMSYYLSYDYEEELHNQISDLQGTGAAMCVERAALAQNLLKFLGINSFYKTSGIIRNNNREVHSYNLIEYNGKYYIFDTSIPNLINNQVSPLIAEIDKETFDLLSNPLPDMGVSVSTDHYNPFRNEKVSITYDAGRSEHLEVAALGAEDRKIS